MTGSKWHEKKDAYLHPKPVFYRLEAEIDGPKWTLCVVVPRMRGNARRKTLQLPKHDAETIKEILESLYGEKWTLVRDGDR